MRKSRSKKTTTPYTKRIRKAYSKGKILIRFALLLLPEFSRKGLALWGSGSNMVEAIRQGSNVSASAVGNGLAAEFAASIAKYQKNCHGFCHTKE